MSIKSRNRTLTTSIFTFIFIFFSTIFISTVSAQLTFSQVKEGFESFVHNSQANGLSPFKIAVKTKDQMTELIKQAANNGMTLKEIAALVQAATEGAVSGCKSPSSGSAVNILYKATCTSRPNKPLGDCAAIVLSLVEGAKTGASNVGMAVSHENRLINAIGAGSGWCVKAEVQKVKQLTNDEKDAIDEAAEAARQLTLNVTSPKL